MTKKQFLEEAIRARALALSTASRQDVWEETRGAWKRRGGAAASVREARAAFQRSMDRHHPPGPGEPSR